MTDNPLTREEVSGALWLAIESAVRADPHGVLLREARLTSHARNATCAESVDVELQQLDRIECKLDRIAAAAEVVITNTRICNAQGAAS